jgi:zinc D-Ala-D-Ala carboxypeptidase
MRITIKHFSESEFTCDGVECYDLMSDELLLKLETARVIAGIPFHLNSSWRSKAYNDSLENSSPNSAHLRGNAVDIACANSSDRYQIIDACMAAGFTRIGIANTFIHIDVDEDLPNNVIWTY